MSGGAIDRAFGIVPVEKAVTTALERQARTTAAMKLVRAEIDRASAKHPAFNSHHEGYAILLEEVDELWDDVKADRHDLAAIEAIQVAAMAVRFLVDCSSWTHVVPPGGTYPSDAVPALKAAHEAERLAAMAVDREHERAEQTFAPGLLNGCLRWLRSRA